MPPIFPPRSNLLARASIGVGLVLLAAAVAAGVWYLHSSAFNQVGVEIPQPVPFPHNFHVTGLDLDCRYCHTSVDNSSFADMPPTQTCMSCHSIVATDSPRLQPVRDSWETGQPVEWNRVNDVPDHVYFNHQIHVNTGIGCETCHGRVDQMTTAVKTETFYMAWCLDCHREPEKFIRPLDEVFTMGYEPEEDQAVLGPRLVEEYDVRPANILMNCSICHR